jgi:prophage antirepressor-like protein
MSNDTNDNDTHGIDMDLEKAIDQFTEITKEENEGQEPQGELLNEGDSQLALFKGKEIRQVFHDDEWVFSIVDVIEAVTETARPRKYWSDLKRKLTETEDFSELSENIGQLKMPAADGKMRSTEVVNTETLFRIVQSIPSKKAENFKKWLAKTGYERIQEIQDPAIAIKRAMSTYRAKGYSDEWINARLQTIVSRKMLTKEWQDRGIVDKEYGILTNVISEGTFGLKTKEHKKLKGLKSQNLRDHMSPLELALTMLGETTTAEMAKTTDAQGFYENESAAHSGGQIAGNARKNIERKLGKKIVTKENQLGTNKQKKLFDK